MGEFNPRVGECLGVTQAAKYAGVSRAAILTALNLGKLKGRKVAHVWVTTKEAIDAYYKRDRLGWLNQHQRVEHAAKVRADWTCQRCGAKSGEVEKFLIYYRDWDRENQTEDNMIVLCRGCHWFAKKTYRPQQLLLPGMELPEWLR